MEILSDSEDTLKALQAIKFASSTTELSQEAEKTFVARETILLTGNPEPHLN